MADGSRDQAGGRVPPSDLDAESAVLSALLLRPKECLDDVRPVLHPQHFYADANRRVYEAILELDNEGRAIDIVMVAGRLRDQGRLDQIGGSPYLAQLSDATPAVSNVLEHAKVIVEKARIRQVITACQRFAAEGYNDVGDPQEWAQHVAQVIADIAAMGDETEPPEMLSDIVPREVEAMRERAALKIELSGVDTRLTSINKLTNGLVVRKAHVVAGRPGMGKTSYALQLGLNVAEQGLGFFIGSAEMEKKELVEKLVSMVARVDLPKVKSGIMHRDEWARVTEASQHLATLPIVLFYQPVMTIAVFRGAMRKAERWFAARGVKMGLGAADYIQLFDGKELIQKGDQREAEVSAIMRRLVWMAGEFRVPMLALSQLNRSVESRSNQNKRPNLSDLRESGAIEQDAYTVTLLYRDEYYHKDSPDKGVAEAELAKNRSGPTGRAYLKFTGEYGRFDNLGSSDDDRYAQQEFPGA